MMYYKNTINFKARRDKNKRFVLIFVNLIVTLRQCLQRIVLDIKQVGPPILSLKSQTQVRRSSYIKNMYIITKLNIYSTMLANFECPHSKSTKRKGG